ncbi:MAG: hypothetical protein MJ060_04180 [Clostridia bacterium]|nr:hypothetical protein [Clostridia bacterium]
MGGRGASSTTRIATSGAGKINNAEGHPAGTLAGGINIGKKDEYAVYKTENGRYGIAEMNSMREGYSLTKYWDTDTGKTYKTESAATKIAKEWSQERSWRTGNPITFQGKWIQPNDYKKGKNKGSYLWAVVAHGLQLQHICQGLRMPELSLKNLKIIY